MKDSGFDAKGSNWLEEVVDLDDGDDPSAWAVSYGDLISVLLCFMILLLSISVVNPNKFEMLNNSMKGIAMEKTSIADLQQKIEYLLEQENLKEVVKVNKNMLGADISIRDKLIFDSGSAEINPQSLFLLKKLLKIFAELPEEYSFQIEGHTDNQPISTASFPSNWYLSGYRALSVLDLFLESGISANRLQVQGFADTRPEFPHFDKKGRPISENRERNRRVIIKVR